MNQSPGSAELDRVTSLGIVQRIQNRIDRHNADRTPCLCGRRSYEANIRITSASNASLGVALTGIAIADVVDETRTDHPGIACGHALCVVFSCSGWRKPRKLLSSGNHILLEITAHKNML